MKLAADIVIGLVAAIHLYIVWFEMFAWETRGRKFFRKLPDEIFKHTIVMMGNQGIYNGFLAAGLIWSYFISDAQWSNNIALFFLSCVAVAGVYGSLTANRSILFIQTLPAALGIALVLLAQ